MPSIFPPGRPGNKTLARGIKKTIDLIAEMPHQGFGYSMWWCWTKAAEGKTLLTPRHSLNAFSEPRRSRALELPILLRNLTQGSRVRVAAGHQWVSLRLKPSNFPDSPRSGILIRGMCWRMDKWCLMIIRITDANGLSPSWTKLYSKANFVMAWSYKLWVVRYRSYKIVQRVY